MIRIDIARRDYLAIIRRQKGLRIARPLPAHADHAKIDAVVGCCSRALLRVAVKHCRQNGRRSGSLQKVASIEQTKSQSVFRTRLLRHDPSEYHFPPWGCKREWTKDRLKSENCGRKGETQ
jgi:hypothetical protein